MRRVTGLALTAAAIALFVCIGCGNEASEVERHTESIELIPDPSVEELELKVEELESQIQELESQVSDIRGAVAEVRSDFDFLQSRIADFTNDPSDWHDVASDVEMRASLLDTSISRLELLLR